MGLVPYHQCAWGQCLLSGASFLGLSEEGSLLIPVSYHSPFCLQAKMKGHLENIWLLGGKWSWEAKKTHPILLRWQPHRTIIILHPPVFFSVFALKDEVRNLLQENRLDMVNYLNIKNGFADSICGRYFLKSNGVCNHGTKLPGILGTSWSMFEIHKHHST